MILVLIAIAMLSGCKKEDERITSTSVSGGGTENIIEETIIHEDIIR